MLQTIYSRKKDHVILHMSYNFLRMIWTSKKRDLTKFIIKERHRESLRYTNSLSCLILGQRGKLSILDTTV